MEVDGLKFSRIGNWMRYDAIVYLHDFIRLDGAVRECVLKPENNLWVHRSLEYLSLLVTTAFLRALSRKRQVN